MQRKNSLPLALLALGIAAAIAIRLHGNSPAEPALSTTTSTATPTQPATTSTLPRTAPRVALSEKCQSILGKNTASLDEIRTQALASNSDRRAVPERVFENIHFKTAQGEERRARYDSSKNQLLLFAVDTDGPIPLPLPPEDQNRPPLELLEEYRQRYKPQFSEVQFHQDLTRGSLTWLERDGQVEELTWINSRAGVQCSSPPMECHCERGPSN